MSYKFPYFLSLYAEKCHAYNNNSNQNNQSYQKNAQPIFVKITIKWRQCCLKLCTNIDMPTPHNRVNHVFIYINTIQCCKWHLFSLHLTLWFPIIYTYYLITCNTLSKTSYATKNSTNCCNAIIYSINAILVVTQNTTIHTYWKLQIVVPRACIVSLRVSFICYMFLMCS